MQHQPLGEPDCLRAKVCLLPSRPSRDFARKKHAFFMKVSLKVAHPTFISLQNLDSDVNIYEAPYLHNTTKFGLSFGFRREPHLIIGRLVLDFVRQCT